MNRGEQPLDTEEKKGFGDYWFETGTPTFLVELLKKSEYDLNNLTHERVTGDVINSIDSMEENPIPVLYQSGYLTIHGYDERFRKYLLGFPNKEVELGFINFIAPYYTGMKPTKAHQRRTYGHGAPNSRLHLHFRVQA